jgi:hypothetical protein
MYGLMAGLIVVFWFVGIVTGMVASIFLLELEDVYLFQPARRFFANLKAHIAYGYTQMLTYPKRALQFVLNLRSAVTKTVLGH